MAYASNTMQIDAERLRRFAAKNGGLAHISRQMGFSESYLSTIITRQKMRQSTANQLSAMYGVPEDFFKAREPEKPKEAAPQGGAGRVHAAAGGDGEAGIPAAGARRREGRQRVFEAQGQQRAGADAGDQLRGTHDLQILRAENAAGIYGG